ncbi:hypothetical protein GGTG_14007 [Gaeumannomyces tritici R3-111a-1]|uniref:Uncharacterized protein n=1 Tax=Gaeumannomyces tritici (strain R3-111a-1) TaxID=644352 RepID=J3PKF3_GAET3|nr:hypothetical protein GGTG_14007 [Gaeumannomyces tritici R3-111a-1]EJT68418.1 hypothetical protein GGTG_14007 [Gaeumannomyces tritici R3-111a-1]
MAPPLGKGGMGVQVWGRPGSCALGPFPPPLAADRDLELEKNDPPYQSSIPDLNNLVI